MMRTGTSTHWTCAAGAEAGRRMAHLNAVDVPQVRKGEKRRER